MVISCRFSGFISRNAHSLFALLHRQNIFTELKKPVLDKCFKPILNVLGYKDRNKNTNKKRVKAVRAEYAIWLITQVEHLIAIGLFWQNNC